MSRRGFTLVELLVVIAIISLLLAMLAPSLNQVKNLAKVSTCMNNQRITVLAILNYASEYEDYVPPYRNQLAELPDGSKPDPQARTNGGIWYLHVRAFPNVPIQPGLSSFYQDEEDRGDQLNISRLPFLGYVETPELFYCPAALAGPFDFQNHPEPWGSGLARERFSVGQHGNKYGSPYEYHPGVGPFLGFSYNPHMEEIKGGDWRREFLRAEDFRADALILTIPIDFGDTLHVFHDIGGTPVFNTAFADGHVESTNSTDAFDWIEKNADTAWDSDGGAEKAEEFYALIEGSPEL
jgi:prepilin-type N-terminal cleavage/methylation domain-containing protein/prepilin-type processing-associated H-X9-DG protein